MIKAIIIDTKNAACIFLENLIKKHCPEIKIEGVANNKEAAIKLIADVNPDLIFLDAEILKENEISFFDKSKLPLFEIIITSNNEEYAVLSYSVSAVDYLLKPIKKEPLFCAMLKYVAKNENDLLKNIHLQLQNDYNNHTNKNLLISIKQSTIFLILNSDEIIYLEAEGNSTKVFIKNAVAPSIADEGMGDLLKRLPKGQFHQIHKSFIVRVKYIKKYDTKGEYVIMINDTTLTIAYRERVGFLALFAKK